MAVYEYEAIAKTGKQVKGIIDADSPALARRKLREQQLHPTNIAESFQKDGQDKSEGFMLGRVSVRDLSLSTRQLAVLLQAGMPLVEALTALIGQTANRRLRKTLYDIRDRVSEGKGLAEAMMLHPQIFNDLFVNMVRAGESSGSLEQVLLRLADILERQAKLRAKVMSTLLYPAAMALFAVGVIVVLMTVIVPRVTQLFVQRDMALPFSTQLLIGTCDVLTAYWYLLLGGIAGLVLFWRIWIARAEGRLAWDRFKLRIPLLGSLYIKIICARFARTLGTMLDNGLTMMVALDIVKSVIQNKAIEQLMDNVKAEVRRGRDLAEPLKESGMFPPMMVQMTELGQRSGELEAMLIKVADTYEDDVQITVDAVVGLLEPVIIVVMGLFVGFLVVSILLPILQMTQSIR